MRAVLAGMAVLGGLCWVGARWVDALELVGVALLGFAAGAAGAGLVSKGPAWLRVVAALGFVTLAGSIVQVLRDNAGDDVVLTACGALAVVVGVVVLVRRPASSRGSHAL